MYIERDIKERFEKVASSYPIVAMVGARQAGKTTFLRKQCQGIYLLFDDPDIRQLFDEDIKKFELQHLQGKLAVLDEVQYCKDPGIKLKYLADTDKKFWITSSSELILSKSVLSYLVGRVSIIRLFPFSFQEFLRAKGQKAFGKDLALRLVWEHATFGGYPKVVESADIVLKKTILRDLYETMILKDVSRSFAIDDIDALERVVLYLSSSIGKLISIDTISSELGISFPTLKKYLDALEKSYFIKKVKPYFINKAKEIKKQPKVYFLDTGLRNALQRKFQDGMEGDLFENYVYTELLKAGFEPKYWRTKTGQEVDFVIEGEKGLIAIEVKVNSTGKIERSLKSFIETYRPYRAFVVFYKGEPKKTKVGRRVVEFIEVAGLSEKLGR